MGLIKIKYLDIKITIIVKIVLINSMTIKAKKVKINFTEYVQTFIYKVLEKITS